MECLIDDHSAVMTLAYFNSLLDYSCSLPTGVIDGKRWKRKINYYAPREELTGWALGSYEVNGDQIWTCWRTIYVV